MDKMNDLKSEQEKGLEKTLRETFEKVPLLMLSDTALMIKNVTNRLCDEYIEKGEQFKKEWALKTVREMFGGNDVQKLDKENESYQPKGE